MWQWKKIQTMLQKIAYFIRIKRIYNNKNSIHDIISIGADNMNLLCEKTFEKESGKKIINLIRDVILGIQRDKKFCFDKLITYENFENLICDFY